MKLLGFFLLIGSALPLGMQPHFAKHRQIHCLSQLLVFFEKLRGLVERYHMAYPQALKQLSAGDALPQCLEGLLLLLQTGKPFRYALAEQVHAALQETSLTGLSEILPPLCAKLGNAAAEQELQLLDEICSVLDEQLQQLKKELKDHAFISLKLWLLCAALLGVILV
ncbi:MAG: hypothetical protein IJP01_02890 [Oscillospiraceae bacterium]|nr:hypothetical protein [Oscillospiraceae bacterium]